MLVNRDLHDISIDTYKEVYANSFKTLNLQWIQEYFVIEEEDIKILSNPKSYVIDKGGEIFFALLEDSILRQSAYFLCV